MFRLYFGLLALCQAAWSTPVFQPLGQTADYAEADYQGVRYGLVKASPEAVSLLWRNAAGTAYRSLGAAHDALKAQGKRALMLMNAGIFTTAQAPAGLWIEQGHTVVALNRNKGQGNFHIQPNGVFSVRNGKARIDTTDAWAKRAAKADYAVQSGPMLLIAGNINSRFVKDLSSPYKRNAVCTTREGELLFVMTLDYEQEWPSFYRLAQALQSFGCYQALYLDGSISSWFVRGKSGTFHWSNFAGIIAVTDTP